MTEFTQERDVEGWFTFPVEPLRRILTLSEEGNVSCDAKKHETLLSVCSHNKGLIKAQSYANSSRRIGTFPEKL